ncbi:MAG: HD domain-containing protein [Actinomycetota bacterium]
MSSVRHLAGRFWGSLSRAQPAASDVEWAHCILLPAEAELWDRQPVQDRRHTLEVARRFVSLAPNATPSEVAGALLHDIGKLQAGSGTCSRVVATVVGPRTKRFRQYHDHEEIGARMLREAGSAELTVELVQGRGPQAQALRAADAL